MLGAKLAYSSVTGIQSQGIIATVKHYVLNNQEQNRNSVSVTVDERTFMELYFPPFQGAIDAKVGAVMCSYSAFQSLTLPRARPHTCVSQRTDSNASTHLQCLVLLFLVHTVYPLCCVAASKE